MVLLIDHYDSFIYNLAHYVGGFGFEYVVKLYDQLTLAGIKKINPSHIILSPGPCTPNEAGVSVELIENYNNTIVSPVPILGVCLGHQIIGQGLGGTIVQAKRPLHGQHDTITHTDRGVLEGLSNPLQVGLYHSLVIEPETLPETLQVTALSSAGEIMAVQHVYQPIFGVQFHPESVLTPEGVDIIERFLKIYRDLLVI